MAVTIELDLTEMYDFDDAANVSSSQGGPATDPDAKVEGTASIASELRSAGVQWIKYTRPAGSWNLQNTHIYLWANCIFASQLATKTNGGLRILVGDGVNEGHWYIEGNDTYGGGWICLVIDTSLAFDWNDGSDPNLAAITEIGIAINIAVGFKNVESTWIDIARYGDGITITSDALCDLDDIIAVSENNTNASGIIRKSGGVFYVQGKLRFGDTDAGDSIQFADESEVIIFEDKQVNANLYEILVQGNATGTIEFKLGAKSGTRGISGCIIKSAGTPKFDFTATDVNIDKLGFYGSSFIEADTISLPAYNINKEVLSCNFEACNEILADNCIIEYSNIINPDSRGLRLNDVDPNVHFKNSNIINAADGIHINVVGTYTLDNIKFSGCTVDIENTSGGSVTIKNTNGSNAATETGDTTIETTVYLRVYVKDEDGNNIENAQVYIEKQSDQTQLMNEDTLASGLAEETFNYGAGPNVDINLRIRKSSTGITRYFPIATIGTITSNGFTYYAVLKEDKIVAA